MAGPMPDPNKCYGCGKSLVLAKARFEWLLSRGYDPKDASAFILHDPTSRMVPNQCCIVGLQTNLDPDKEVRERDRLKEELQQDKAQELKDAGLPPKIREEVEVFAATENLSDAGHFIIRDGIIEDPVLLAGIPGTGQTGFEITDVVPIPKYIADAEGWGNERPLCLMSGHMKIIPVIMVGMSLIPTRLHVRTANSTSFGHTVLSTTDKTLIGAEVLSYTIRDLPVTKLDPITGQQVQITTPFHVILLRKQFPEHLFH